MTNGSGGKTQFSKKVLLCIPGWSGIHYAPQDVLELEIVLGEQACTFMPSKKHRSQYILEGNVSRGLLTNVTCKPPLILTVAYSVIY